MRPLLARRAGPVLPREGESATPLSIALWEERAEFLSWLYQTKIIEASQTARRKCLANLIPVAKLIPS